MTLLWYAAAFALGAWVLQQLPVLPNLTGAAAIVPLAGLGLFLGRRFGRPGKALGCMCLACACTGGGFYWAAAVAQWKLSTELPLAWEGRDVELSGVVAEMTQPFPRGVRATFDVENVLTPGAVVPARVALNWYEEIEPGDSELAPGQRWRVTVRLRRPHGNSNPHGFDAEQWLLEQGVRATGYVRAAPAPRLLNPSVPGTRYLIERLRQQARQKLQRELPERPYAGVIVALAIGDQRAIAPDQWRIFTRTGINHLMSISGLHITMVASLVFAVVAKLWGRSERLALRMPALRAATLAGMGAAFAYAALAGFAVPAQRTVYMLAAVAAALYFGWQWSATTVLGLALLTVIALDPMAVDSAGFWLSFGAIAAIMLAGSSRLHRPGMVRGWLNAQWAVTVALVPLLLALFQQVSVVSPAANAIAIPLVSLIVAPLALVSLVSPWDGVAQLAHAAMVPGMLVLEWLARLPAAAWEQHAPTSWTVAAALAGVAMLLLPRGFPARGIGVIAMLPMFVEVPPNPGAGELWLTVLDVGQGLAVVARTTNHALLFDAGPSYDGVGDAGARVVVPYLRGEGVRRLDAMIVSHDDTDHSGGAASVLDAIPVARLLSSLPSGHPLHAAAVLSARCEAGQRWQWDEVEFEVLHPKRDSYNDAGVKDNDRSCVLRLATASGAALIAADIERRSERELLAGASQGIAAQILLAPHHGSRTSSTPEFVRAVGARYVVFAAGYRNRFGHPHPAVVARYRAGGAQALRTDVGGALTFRFEQDGVQVQDWRRAAPRYWHTR